MTSTSECSANATLLERWLRSTPGGYMHPALRISADNDRGLHWRAVEHIPPSAKLITVPHSLALSYLNALVDDAYPVFKQRRSEFTVEAIGFFYLMLQHINKATSFWRPYLEALPAPSSELCTPLYFESDADKQWLATTDVEHTMKQRQAIYEEYYKQGTAILQQSGVDTSQFSWPYFRWAITMFTSRSFSSRSISPHESKYWTTYKTGPAGQRQTVVLDMGHAPAGDLDFSVLFPAIDAGNHDHTRRVHWDFDPGRFSITTLDDYNANSEVFNTYGPKSNAELLQGYGFCIEGNPNDVVLLTLRPLLPELQQVLRKSHKGYFNDAGSWDPVKATFELRVLPATAMNVFEALPKSLLELLLLQSYWSQHGTVVMDDFQANAELLQQRYQPHTARILQAALGAKLERLLQSTPKTQPCGNRQRVASIYRSSQIDILRAYLTKLQRHMFQLTSLQPEQRATHEEVRLVRLEDLAASDRLGSSSIYLDFMQGIEAVSNATTIDQLREAGWEDDVWVLLLTYLHIYTAESGGDIKLLGRLHTLLSEVRIIDAQVSEQAVELLELVHTAAEHLPSSLWSSRMWSASLIDHVGGKIVRDDGFQVVTASKESPASVLTVYVPS